MSGSAASTVPAASWPGSPWSRSSSPRSLPVTAAARRTPTSSIDGAGSTWSQIALDQWAADVARQGFSVNYQGVGSTSGRVFYYQDQIDFAVVGDPVHAGVPRRDRHASSPTRSRSPRTGRTRTCPIVAGGTSFMYHLDINGQRVTNLRLSPDDAREDLHRS